MRGLRDAPTKCFGRLEMSHSVNDVLLRPSRLRSFVLVLVVEGDEVELRLSVKDSGGRCRTAPSSSHDIDIDQLQGSILPISCIHATWLRCDIVVIDVHV
jgi:hypothetical protein